MLNESIKVRLSFQPVLQYGVYDKLQAIAILLYLLLHFFTSSTVDAVRNFAKRNVAKYPESPTLVSCIVSVKLPVCDFEGGDSG